MFVVVNGGYDDYKEYGNVNVGFFVLVFFDFFGLDVCCERDNCVYYKNVECCVFVCILDKGLKVFGYFFGVCVGFICFLFFVYFFVCFI